MFFLAFVIALCLNSNTNQLLFSLWRPSDSQERRVQLRGCASGDADWAARPGQEPPPGGAEPHRMGEAVPSQQKKSPARHRRPYTRPIHAKRGPESSHSCGEMPSCGTQAPPHDEGSGGRVRAASRHGWGGTCAASEGSVPWRLQQTGGLVPEAFAPSTSRCFVVNWVDVLRRERWWLQFPLVSLGEFYLVAMPFWEALFVQRFLPCVS